MEEGRHVVKMQYMTQSGAIECNMNTQVFIQIYSAVEVPIMLKGFNSLPSPVNAGFSGRDL
jgi:hypothetical protein